MSNVKELLLKLFNKKILKKQFFTGIKEFFDINCSLNINLIC